MNTNVKTALMVLGGMAVVSTAVIAGNAIYTNSKVGVDKKALIISGVLGFTIGYTLLKFVK